VERIGIATSPPFTANWTKLYSAEGITKPGDQPVLTRHAIVAGDYFEVLHIPLRRGRSFGLGDRKESEKVILVNQAFARQVFGDADPVGRRIKNGTPETEAPGQTIVGVVGDAKLDRMSEEAPPQTFAFAVVALLLSAVGIAGVTGVAVTQRQHEIGLRMALGADRGRILRDVLGGGLRLVLAGVALGIAGGLALSRVVAGFLYGVAATNAATFAGAAGLLLATGLLATYVPARRAAALDPMVSLRQE
jgi:ABC-type antimicrobial peptide transport system permease subunit